MNFVAITQRIDHWRDRGETRDAVDQQLVRWVMECGYLPILIPNVFDSQIALLDWLEKLQVNRLVFSGGNDVGQNSQRDNQEQWLLAWAEQNRIPSLGICRGMQAMALHHGAELQPVDNHVATRHSVSGAINLVVNSYHQFSIIDTPLNWRALAYSEDLVLEAMKHDSLPWEGWMFHPEREKEFDPELKLRFCALMDSEI